MCLLAQVCILCGAKGLDVAPTFSLRERVAKPIESECTINRSIEVTSVALARSEELQGQVQISWHAAALLQGSVQISWQAHHFRRVK